MDYDYAGIKMMNKYFPTTKKTNLFEAELGMLDENNIL
jgi:hypothetical protein